VRGEQHKVEKNQIVYSDILIYQIEYSDILILSNESNIQNEGPSW
jgi:hypothetical protein